ncbi:hypothetical protein MK079_04395 [Candidatus Gracilibacteria bacterium]|nr:hypothetical protein [Candidatus Gracilibacteria bacterium]
MNTFAGNITYTGDYNLDHVDADCLEIDTGEKKILFLAGQTDFGSSQGLIDDFKKHITGVVYYDISLSTEDQVDIMNPDIPEDGIYECVTFEGPDVDYTQVIDRFHDAGEVVVIRESQDSNKFGNKIIKVDFIY